MTDAWAASSNEALSLSLVGSPLPTASRTFHPSFTYPIYGEAETIYGYKGLSIRLAFASGSLRPSLTISHSARKETGDDVDEADAIRKVLPKDEELLQGKEGDEALQREDASFRPVGDLVRSYTRPKSSMNGKGKGKARAGAGLNGGSSSASASSDDVRHFEVYRCKYSTPGFLKLHRRMQVFALLFIEAASFIEEEGSDAWEFYVTYERTGKGGDEASYHFVGYTSLYSFWCMKKRGPTDEAAATSGGDSPLLSRVRLSQFLVLPPYQGAGHGAALYDAAYTAIIDRPNVLELTVEDPSEAFDRLRDGCDLRRLTGGPDSFLGKAKAEGKLKAPVDAEWKEDQRLRHKIAPRQWTRLVEMLQLLVLDTSDKQALKSWRIQLKRRFYSMHRDILKEMPREERQMKLQQTFVNVIDEYAELVGVDVDDIVPMNQRLALAGVDEEDEDEDEEDDDDEDEEGMPPPKRGRFA